MTNKAVVTLCGSIRKESSNLALLRAYAALAGPRLQFSHCEKLDALPHFNPDLDVTPLPAPVLAFRRSVDEADAVVICTPEYIHALPGALKNALEWLVSDPAVAGKPVVILHIARGSTWALDSLREVLSTMSAVIVEEACLSVTLGSNVTTPEALLAQPEIQTNLVRSQAALARFLGV